MIAMENERISIEVFCQHEQVDITFVRELHDRGLIQLVVERSGAYIHARELPRLEQLVRLHDHLDINLEGIEAITHLLERVQRMQEELRGLRDRLRLYEEE